MPASNNDTITMAEYLGVDHKVVGGTGIGGAVFEFVTQHAIGAIRDGQCDTALVSYGSALLTTSGRSLGTTSMLKDGEPVSGLSIQAPFGPGSRTTPWRLGAMRVRHDERAARRSRLRCPGPAEPERDVS
jgi:hypothetical protein